MKNDAKKLAKLLTAAQNGDSAALQNLCRELQLCVRGYFARRFREQAVVDDLAQETYLRLLKNILTVREGMKLRAFVARVAFHVTQDHLREKYRRRETSFEKATHNNALSAAESAIQPAASESDLSILHRVDLEFALAQLPEKSRTILGLKAEGYKYEEIAERMQLSLSGVKMQIKRSLAYIKTKLQDVTFLALFATILVTLRKLSDL